MAGTSFHVPNFSFHTAAAVFACVDRFVSCVGINLLAKTLVVREIIVIQNGHSTHVIDATSFVQKQCCESCGG
jgi:hypothetical protein